MPRRKQTKPPTPLVLQYLELEAARSRVARLTAELKQARKDKARIKERFMETEKERYYYV